MLHGVALGVLHTDPVDLQHDVLQGIVLDDPLGSLSSLQEEDSGLHVHELWEVCELGLLASVPELVDDPLKS